MRLAGVSRGSPEDAGIDAEALEDHRRRGREHEARNVFPGRTECVIRDNKLVFFDAHGKADRESSTPVTQRTRFRGFSMTKSITAIGLLVLADEGCLKLDDDVGRYIPSFGKLVVLRRESKDLATVSPEDGKHVEALKRPVTIRHLMMHTSGLGYGAQRLDVGRRLVTRTAVEKAHRKLTVAMDAGEIRSLSSFCDSLARIPLRFQPGTRWQYSHGVDVAGRVIEVVSGRPLERFLRERVLIPLGMTDTAFTLPKSVASQHLSAQYTTVRVRGRRVAPGTRRLERLDGAQATDSAWVKGSPRQPSVASGGGFWGSCSGGLVFSLRDVALFCNFLANSGVGPSGQPLLKARTAKLLRKDWLAMPSVASRHPMKRPLPGWDDEGGGSLGWNPIGHVQMSGPHAGAQFMGGVGYWWVDARRKLVAVTLSDTVWDDQPKGWVDSLDDIEKLVQESLAKKRSAKRGKVPALEPRAQKLRKSDAT